MNTFLSFFSAKKGIFAFGLTVLLAYMAFPYWKPLVFAAFMAIVLEPLARRLNRQGFGRSALIFLMVLLTIGLLTILVGSLVRETLEFGSEIIQRTSSPEAIQTFAKEKMPFIDQLKGFLNDNLGIEIAEEAKLALFQAMKTSSQWILKELTGFLGSLPTVALDVFVFVFALYYFVVDSRRLRAFLLNTSWLEKRDRRFIVSAAKGSVQAVFLSSSLIALIQASIMTAAALFLSTGQPVLVFIVTFIFSFIPVLGTAPVGLFLAIVSFSEGMNGSGIGFLIATVIAGTGDNLVRPFLVGSNLHPVVALISVVGGLWAFGILGLFLGPVVFDLGFKIFAHWGAFELEDS